jgi:hypothetical protein
VVATKKPKEKVISSRDAHIIDIGGLEQHHAEALRWLGEYVIRSQDSQKVQLPDSTELLKLWFSLGEMMGVSHVFPSSVLIHDDMGSGPLCLIMASDQELVKEMEKLFDRLDLEPLLEKINDPTKVH